MKWPYKSVCLDVRMLSLREGEGILFVSTYSPAVCYLYTDNKRLRLSRWRAL